MNYILLFETCILYLPFAVTPRKATIHSTTPLMPCVLLFTAMHTLYIR